MTKEQAMGDERSQFLVFNLHGEQFGIPLLGVKEIIEYGGVTAVPAMPRFIRGVINLRGRVVPVIDLGARLGERETELTTRTCIVIVELREENGSLDLGIVVDGVSAVSDVPPEEIEPPPRFGAHIRADFIEGMWKRRERFVILLNQPRVLSVEEINHLAAQVETERAA